MVEKNQPDKKTPAPAENTPTLPEEVKRAIKDLTSTQSVFMGGLAFPGYDPIWGRLTEDGVRVITYSFDKLPNPNVTWSNTSGHKPLGNQNHEQEQVRKALDDIEQVARVKFVPAALMEIPDILYVHGKIGIPQQEAATFSNTSPKLVVFSQDMPLRPGTAVHETGHALGLSHPGDNGVSGPAAGGFNPNYTTQDTMMSYNNMNMDGNPLETGIAKDDVWTLHSLYKKPKPENTPTVTITDQTLTNDKRVLFAQKPVTLDLQNLDRVGGGLAIDMANVIKGQIGYSGAEKTNGVFTTIFPGTQLENVLAGEKTQISLDVIGNALPNIIQGGKWPDRLIPIGGNDTLTGGEGSNKFILLRESGFNNVITDFKPTGADADKIQIGGGIANINMIYREDFPYKGGVAKGTEVIATEKDGKKIASIFVLNTKKDEVIKALGLVDRFEYRYNAPAQVHPSGLPNEVKKPDAPAPTTPKR